VSTTLEISKSFGLMIIDGWIRIANNLMIIWLEVLAGGVVVINILN